MQLTNDEQKSLIKTGRAAYRMLIPITGNPHSKLPQRDLWDKGWRLERKKDVSQYKPRDANRPPFKKPGDQNFTKHRHPKKHERRQQAPREPQPVMTEKLIERFNRRHQTQVS